MQILTVLVVRPYCELHVLCVVDASAGADASAGGSLYVICKVEVEP